MLGVALKSLEKGFVKLGILAASGALAVAASPETTTPLFTDAGVLGVIAVLGINQLAQVGIDFLKHRNDGDEE